MTITEVYLNYKETGSQRTYNSFYKQLRKVLYSKLSRDDLFKAEIVTEFDDILQDILMKLHLKDTYNNKKGTIVNYVYMMFLNKIIDVKRKEFRYKKIKIDDLDVY